MWAIATADSLPFLRAVIGTTFPLTFAHRALHGSDASTTRSGRSSAGSLVACTVQGRESVIKPFKLGGETSAFLLQLVDCRAETIQVRGLYWLERFESQTKKSELKARLDGIPPSRNQLSEQRMWREVVRQG